jgi:hypothetical protein
MICKNPYIIDAVPFGCKQCLPCRINGRRLWTNRIMLESLTNESNAFVTLTYSDDNLPKGGTLVPQHLKDWQKRMRYHSGIPLRFFSVGEYGEETKRPHYHAAIFGYQGCSNLDPKCPCIFCKTLRTSWDYGFTLNGTLTKDSAAYIAGYVTKKMTDRNPEEKYARLLKKGKVKIAEDYKKRVIDELNGKHPEFARMSLRPGIGAPAIPALRDLLWTEHGNELLSELQDVPDIIKIGGREVLLGSYLKNKLREEIGIDEEIKEKKLSQLRAEKIEEYITYRSEKKEGEKILSQKEFLLEKHLQKVRNIEGKFSRKHKKGVL